MKRISLILLLSIGLLISCVDGGENKHSAANESREEVVINNILNRRSIRSYQTAQVREEQLDKIMKCAIYAPNALNQQSWQVRVVQNEDLLKRMNQSFVNQSIKNNPGKDFSSFQTPEYSIYYNAPTVIFVAREKGNFMNEIDCGLLVQNILLSAEAMDIGTCVLGGLANSVAEDVELLSELHLPESHEICIAVAIGYKNERPEIKPRDPDKVQYIR